MNKYTPKYQMPETNSKRALTKYEEAVYAATGLVPEYVKAKTPFLEEDSRFAPHRQPWSTEDFYECPSCAHTVPVSAIPKLTHKANT